MLCSAVLPELESAPTSVHVCVCPNLGWRWLPGLGLTPCWPVFAVFLASNPLTSCLYAPPCSLSHRSAQTTSPLFAFTWILTMILSYHHARALHPHPFQRQHPVAPPSVGGDCPLILLMPVRHHHCGTWSSLVRRHCQSNRAVDRTQVHGGALCASLRWIPCRRPQNLRRRMCRRSTGTLASGHRRRCRRRSA